jgi:ribosome maturation factor RimP
LPALKQADRRIFIDKPNGVTHDDCSEESTSGNDSDVEDFIQASYTSKYRHWTERGLYKRADYERFAGTMPR